VVTTKTPPDVTGVTHEWVDAGGLRMHVALAGPADAPPLLLVHGWPQHWWVWRDVIPQLAERHRLICPDLRGHGWTDAPPDGYEKEQFASDLFSLLDTMGIERVTWVGHDWGGWTGMLAALRAPERVERLFVLGVPHLWVGRGDPRRLALLGYQGPISMPGLGPIVARGFPRALLRAGRKRGKYTREELDTYSDVLRARPRVSVAVYRTLLRHELPESLRGRYADQQLAMPTTLLAGGKDIATVGVKAGPVDGQPNMTVEIVDGVGHFLPEEAPEAVLAAVSSR
jgi:pimeloyl-ACP methyl ester carboxylesterase